MVKQTTPMTAMRTCVALVLACLISTAHCAHLQQVALFAAPLVALVAGDSYGLDAFTVGNLLPEVAQFFSVNLPAHLQQECDRQGSSSRSCTVRKQASDNYLSSPVNRTTSVDKSDGVDSVDECLSRPCANGAACIDHLLSYHCNCQPGFTGYNCQTALNECDSTPCLHNATCVDGVSSYACQCARGFSGINCKIDDNECHSSPCANGAICEDGVDGYVCTCTSKWSGSDCTTEVHSMYSYLDHDEVQDYQYKASVTSSRSDYYTVPAVADLQQLSASELRAVKNFRVGRVGYGEVRWLDEVDLRGVNLDQVISMDRDTITVYDDKDTTTEKPSMGNGLNKPALLTLYSVFSPAFDVNFEQAVRESIETAAPRFRVTTLSPGT